MGESEPKDKGGRPATVVLDEVIDLVMGWKALGFYKHQIKRKLEEALGTKVSIKTFEQVFTRARDLMIANTRIPRDEHLSESIDFYREQVQDKDLPPRLRQIARQRLDNILGLEQQFKDSDNKSAEDLARETRESLAEMEAADGSIVEAAGGNAATNSESAQRKESA